MRMSHRLGLLIGAALLLAAAAGAQEKEKARDYSFTPVLHSVSYGGVWRGQAKLSLDEFLLKAKELGFANVEVMAKRPHLCPLDFDAAARVKLKARLKELGLKLVCLAGYPDFLAGSDRKGIPSAEINAIYVAELARLAKDLDVPYIRVFTGYERQGHLSYDEQWGVVVQGLKMASQAAAQYGVTLLVQNHHDIAIHPDAQAWLIKEINEPNCKAAFDAWSPALMGINGAELAAAAKKMAPLMAYTTVADYVKHPRAKYDANLTDYLPQDLNVRAVPIGEGFIDYHAFFDALKKAGYKGYVAYEMCEVLDGGGSIENLDKTARKFLSWMSEMSQ